jgi:hypothetical protein
MAPRELTENEIMQRNQELAEFVCKRIEALQRKADFQAAIRKEIRHYDGMIDQLAQEINAGHIEEEAQRSLPMEKPVETIRRSIA